MASSGLSSVIHTTSDTTISYAYTVDKPNEGANCCLNECFVNHVWLARGSQDAGVTQSLPLGQV